MELVKSSREISSHYHHEDESLLSTAAAAKCCCSQVGLLPSGGWGGDPLVVGGPLLVEERTSGSEEMRRPRRHSDVQPTALPPAEAAESAPTHRRNKSHSSITNNMKGLVTTLKNRLGTPRNSNSRASAENRAPAP